MSDPSQSNDVKPWRAPRSWCASWPGAALLVVLCACVFLPGLFTLPPVDRDESRFAQASRQMLESNDWVIPRVQDRPRLNKPPLIYWLQASSAKVFGDPVDGRLGNIWVYRVPSAVCALLTVLLVWRLGLKMMDARAAVLAGAMLAVSPMLVWDAHQARADQLLVLTVALAQFCLFQVFRAATSADPGRARQSWPWALGLWLSIGLGVLTKGPITPLVSLLTVLGICIATGRWVWTLRTHFLGGLVLVSVMMGPWVWAVANRVGWENYRELIWNETIGRSTEPAEGHWGPPGYHLVLVAVLFWPGVLLTAAAVAHAWRRARSDAAGAGGVFGRVRLALRGRGVDVFLLAWIVPAWVMFELISTKLPHYPLVLYPALALLSARTVYSATAGSLPGVKTLGSQMGFGVWAAVGCIVPPGIIGGLAWIQRAEPDVVSIGAAVLGALATLGATILGIRFIRRGLFAHAMWATITGMVIWTICLLQFVLPATSTVWISPRLMAVIDADRSHAPLGVKRDPAIGLVEYHEDSMLFLTRGRAQRVDADRLDVWVKQHPRAYICVQRPSAKRPSMPESAAETLGQLEIIGEVSGLNYSTGERVTIDIYRKGAP